MTRSRLKRLPLLRCTEEMSPGVVNGRSNLGLYEPAHASKGQSIPERQLWSHGHRTPPHRCRHLPCHGQRRERPWHEAQDHVQFNIVTVEIARTAARSLMPASQREWQGLKKKAPVRWNAEAVKVMDDD